MYSTKVVLESNNDTVEISTSTSTLIQILLITINWAKLCHPQVVVKLLNQDWGKLLIIE